MPIERPAALKIRIPAPGTSAANWVPLQKPLKIRMDVVRPAARGAAEPSVIACVDASVLLRVVLRQRDAQREWVRIPGTLDAINLASALLWRAAKSLRWRHTIEPLRSPRRHIDLHVVGATLG